MAIQHTRGPWRALFTTLDNAVIGWHITGPKHGSVYPVCEHRVIEIEPEAGEQIANAHLIAAAPELLAALEAGYSDLRTRLIEHAQVAFLMSADEAAQYVDKAWPVLEQMRAAIAKARGDAQ